MVPVVVTVPLLVLLTFSRQIPVMGTGDLLGSGERIFLIGTLAGLPMVWCLWGVGVCVARRRWQPVLALAGLGVVGTAAIAAGWIWVDRKLMAGSEHYGWEGWGLVVMVGTYVATVVWGVRRDRLLERTGWCGGGGCDSGGCGPWDRAQGHGFGNVP